MTKLMLRRVRYLVILVILVFITLIGRLAHLQILQHDYYWRRAELNRFTKITLPAPRGEIFDASGEVLATNRPGFVVSLMDMGDGYDAETIRFLAEILGIEEEEIYKQIRGQLFMRYLPLRLKSDITPEIIAQISENRWRLKGVNIDVHPIREYRFGGSAAHILGYLGQGPVRESVRDRWIEEGLTYKEGDLVGQDGIEQTWEPWLRGTDGEQIVETNNIGQIIDHLDRKEPVAGHNLYLTLDLGLQRVAEEALARRVEILRNEESGGNRFAGRATAVVMDPNSGAILAMANHPSFDLNTIRLDFPALRDDPQRPLVNTAIMGTYHVGSTFKMVTGAAVLNSGIWRESDIITCPGVVRLVGANAECFRQRAHGRLNFFDAMAVSCNIYFYRAGLAVGIDRLAAYARQFGFGHVTGLLDLLGEEPGILVSREQRAAVSGESWEPSETMWAAIGQLSAFTALQLAGYVAIIANGGNHWRPYLVQRVVDFEGNIVRETTPEVLRRADIRESTFALLRESMRRVTQPRGTAWFHFSSFPVTVAGKTGSAQVADIGSGIPAHSLFVGFAPYERPEIAVAVIVEHGGIGATGALPVAAEIMAHYFLPQTDEELRRDDDLAQPPAN